VLFTENELAERPDPILSSKNNMYGTVDIYLYGSTS
jgi:hypothetical protein